IYHCIARRCKAVAWPRAGVVADGPPALSRELFFCRTLAPRIVRTGRGGLCGALSQPALTVRTNLPKGLAARGFAAVSGLMKSGLQGYERASSPNVHSAMPEWDLGSESPDAFAGPRGRKHRNPSRGRRQFRAAGDDVFHRQRFKRSVAPGAKGLLSEQDTVSA